MICYRMEVRYTSVMFTQTQNYPRKPEKMKCFGVSDLFWPVFLFTILYVNGISLIYLVTLFPFL